MQELEKILEEIRKAFEENTEYIADEDGCHHFVIDGCTATYLVNQIIRKHMNDGWIRVGEQLPEEGAQVIVATEDGMVYGDIVYGYADETDSDPCFHRWDDEYWQCFKPIVIAWRPLPESYHPESETEKPDWRQDMLRKFDRRE